MRTIFTPQKPKYTKLSENNGKFEIMGCYPGYGTTLGNAIRRVLLSSLEGAAATSIKVKGAAHEFSTLPGVMEDVVQIILNLKKVRFKMEGDEPVKVVLKSKGEGKVTAKDIKCPTGIEIVNKDQIIATVTDKKNELEIEIEISKGLGYIPVEQQIRENKEIGVIAMDAVYTPIKRVNYNIEDMRVGKRTDYNKITFEVETDGSVTPQEAFQKAVEILINQFSSLVGIQDNVEDKKEENKIKVEDKKEEGEKNEVSDPLKINATDLKGLSNRTLNVLEASNIAKVKEIVKMTEDEIKELKGMGAKGIKEIKKAIGEFGLTLK